jgi:hypothetical protein
MRNALGQIKIPGAVLGMVVFLTSGGIGQDKSQAAQNPGTGGARTALQPQTEDIPLCNGSSAGTSAGMSAGRGSAPVNPHPHSVTLSWNAAVPTSSSPRDAIKGYYVYRSLKPHMYAESNRISDLPLRGTRCVDTNVEPRKTYFYVVKTVTEGGTKSGSSIEIKAEVPSP